ncbi:MAG: hypothetical protein CMH55_07080 [Myxococcales bacterium]|nr:hypothetical protein [Myxococcales bacterium]
MILGLLILATPMSPMESTLEERRELLKGEEEDLTSLAPEAYQQRAKDAYDRAQSYLKRGLGIEAAAAFREVTEKYPFSTYATEAELGAAEAEAVQGNSEMAIAAFTRFIEQHPTHARLVEARYGIIKVLEEQWPGDFFLLPPPHERDLEDVEATVLALSVFFRHHPEDARVESLKGLQVKAWALLYKRQMYLARWNEQQGRLRAALQRVENARQRYPDVSENPEDIEWVKDLRSRVQSVKDEVKAPELHPARSAFQREKAP